MDSKMKPLWLVFENSDFASEDIAIIFKYGDGTTSLTCGKTCLRCR